MSAKEDCAYYHREPYMGGGVDCCTKYKELGKCPCEGCDKYISNKDILKNPVPILITHSNGIKDAGYLDKTRNLIFDSYITCEFASFLGNTWEELEDD